MLSNKSQKLAGFGLVILVCVGIACNSKSNDGDATGNTGSSRGSVQAANTPGFNSSSNQVISQGGNVASSTTAVASPSQ